MPNASQPTGPAGPPGGVREATGRGAPPHDPLPDLEMPDLRIVREVARGGFGVVYEAVQPSLNRTVAVKLVLAEVHDERVRVRFQRECTAMGLLSHHPHIVTVFDAGFSPPGQPYIVMDYMPGGSLAQTVERDGPMAWAEVLSVVVKLASALETAHRAGVLHRDVKPENVLWSVYGQPELGDFGIARITGSPETRSETLTASIAHVAPELLAGAPPSVATDLYALGSTAFVLLSGRTAFVRDTDEGIVPALSRIASAPVPDLRPEGVPEVVAGVVERLMAKDPHERFDTALDLARHCQGLQRRLGLPLTPLQVAEEAADPGVVPGGALSPDADTVESAAPAPPADERPSAGPTGDAGPPPLPPEQPGPEPRARPAAASADTAGDRSPPPLAEEVPDHGVERPPGRLRRRRVPLLVAGGSAAVVAVAAVLVLRGGATEPSIESPTIGTVVEADIDVADGADAAGGAGEPLDVTRWAEQVAEIRHLPPADRIDARRHTPDSYGPLVRAYAGEVHPGSLEAEGRLLAALRLLPPDVDYAELTQTLWDEQFHSFYDEAGGTAHVRLESVDEEALSAVDRNRVAGVVMHALIDSVYDLARLRDEAADVDASRALGALVIGDVATSAEVWSQRFLTSAERQGRRVDLLLDSSETALNAPPAAQQAFLHAHDTGPRFLSYVLAAWDVVRLDDAYADALDRLYVEPPTTTEQIIHPEKYLEGEGALPVEVTAAPPGEGWSEVLRRPFGEYDLEVLFADLDAATARNASAGWGGGEVALWERGDESAVTVWLEMDTPEDGTTACEVVPDYYVLSGGGPAAGEGYASADDVMALHCDGAVVRFAVAPDEDTARTLLD